jgi:hypothetical protein
MTIKNLASKTLTLTTRRLSDDWSASYGHPVLLAETFVDEPTQRRTIQQVDAAAVDAAINAWLLRQSTPSAEALAIDGKTCRGSKNRQGAQTQ